MKAFLTILILGVIGFQFWDKFIVTSEAYPLYSKSYVAVYGPKNHEQTQAFLDNLYLDGVDYEFFATENKEHLSSLLTRLKKSGLSKGNKEFPVIDVNGYLSIKPDYKDIYLQYSKSI